MAFIPYEDGVWPEKLPNYTELKNQWNELRYIIWKDGRYHVRDERGTVHCSGRAGSTFGIPYQVVSTPTKCMPLDFPITPQSLPEGSIVRHADKCKDRKVVWEGDVFTFVCLDTEKKANGGRSGHTFSKSMYEVIRLGVSPSPVQQPQTYADDSDVVRSTFSPKSLKSIARKRRLLLL